MRSKHTTNLPAVFLPLSLYSILWFSGYACCISSSVALAEEIPLVQMLVPGFSVRELPVELTNINNLRYRKDGQLYALGYNGDIWLLSDRDDDGLEEYAKKFFENAGRLRGPIGMAVIPDDHALLASSVHEGRTVGQGVVVASKGKVSAILDLDGDDVAEEERVIATGWVEIPQNVDSIGVAISPVDGAIFFGLGVKDYNKAYQLDETGKSRFDLNTQRGTIQRIAPDLSERQTVCTGIRFTIGLQFDQYHQLFATEQEGATWLPNGNPFDELLHIQPNRHYGFPPRHPKHLPNVFDEPSLFDYRPQHQSTCGLTFNLPLQPNGPIFGPASWLGDAFICGQSRGKLYRTKLIRNSEGQYLATNQLIGCLGMLTVDCCLSPHGDLLVACHSGGPDWGSGPSGKGKIFQIKYREPPQGEPIAIWSAGPQEVRVEFDKPLALESIKNLGKRVSIEYGEYVAAADRFETIRPGYAATKAQQATHRDKLDVYSSSLTPDRRTLIFSTAIHNRSVAYAMSLPGLGHPSNDEKPNSLPQIPDIDLAYSLQGVQVDWKSKDGSLPDWKGWLPHVDLRLAKQLTDGMQHATEFWHRIEQPGILTMKTQLNPRGLFYPAIQPGASLDYEPDEDQYIQEASFELECLQPFSWGESDSSLKNATQNGERFSGRIVLPNRASRNAPLIVQLQTGNSMPSVSVQWSARLSDNKSCSGTLHLDRFLLPWAESDPSASASSESSPSEIVPELADANWGRGRRIFLGQAAGCSKCHAVNGLGATVGPDLSNLIHRDYESVLRDVKQPSFSINPDFTSYNVRLNSSQVLVGSLRSEGDQFWISDRDAKVTSFSKSEIDELKPSSVSVMPEGIVEKLDPKQLNDLMAFLLKPAPRMPRVEKLPPPRSRRRSEVESVLRTHATDSAGNSNAAAQNVLLKPLNVLLVAGKKDHGPGEHDYPAWLHMWSNLMSAADEVTLDTAMEWPTEEQLQIADTIVFSQKGKWTNERAAKIDQHLGKGGGLVYIHWAVEAGKDAPLFAQRIGLASNSSTTKYRHGDVEFVFQTTPEHPIARNFNRLALHDESYWNLHGDPKRIQTIGTAVEDGEIRPQFWSLESGSGRIFVSIPGHYSSTFDDPLFRILLLRGIAWSAKEPVDRFNELVLLGVALEAEAQ
ncbi:MAG: ThuA domain-containing protein [Pirellulaceae bacterium]|nr:ThuA domain-containing protein [Pirellulaceae bacterium]